MRRALATFGMAWLVAFPVQAATVLYYADSIIGTNYVTPALTAGSHTVTTAVSWADFNTKLAGGGYQLVIALNQNSGIGADLPTMQNYIAGGGRVILADWTQTATFATALGGGYTGTTNQNSLNFLVPALSAGITKPQVLSNPGWGTYSMGETVGGSSTSVCSFPNSNSCAVSGNGGRTLLLGFLSDTPSATDGVRLWTNLINFVLTGAGPTTLQPVPTLGQWSLLALALLLAAVAGLYLRRRG